MKEAKRYTCGSGDGMFDDNKGYYVEYSDYKILLDKYNQALSQNDVVGQSEQLRSEVFTLANKLALNGHGDLAVRMHMIANAM
jgi:hypothetical protein